MPVSSVIVQPLPAQFVVQHSLTPSLAEAIAWVGFAAVYHLLCCLLVKACYGS